MPRWRQSFSTFLYICTDRCVYIFLLFGFLGAGNLYHKSSFVFSTNQSELFLRKKKPVVYQTHFIVGVSLSHTKDFFYFLKYVSLKIFFFPPCFFFTSANDTGTIKVKIPIKCKKKKNFFFATMWEGKWAVTMGEEFTSENDFPLLARLRLGCLLSLRCLSSIVWLNEKREGGKRRKPLPAVQSWRMS